MIRNSRPKFVPLTPNKLNKKKVLSYYGGKFPVCNGKKYRYPKPEEEEKWMKLISSALTYRNKMFYNHRHGLKPVKRNSKYEYLLYHCRPEQKVRRNKRNKDRRELSKTVDLTNKHVHHENPISMSLKETVVLTENEHRKHHSKEKKDLIKDEKNIIIDKELSKSKSISSSSSTRRRSRNPVRRQPKSKKQQCQ
jgi:hypothetical protein